MAGQTVSKEQRLEKSLYQTLAAVTGSATLDYVLPNNSTFIISEMGGQGVSGQPLVVVKIIWDPAGDNEILFATHGDGQRSSSRSFIGDGLKVIRISIANQSTTGATVGGYFTGMEIT